jgi:hypothetical protein
LGAPVGNVPVVTREKGPAPKVKVPPARAIVPVLVTVRLRALLVVPVAQLRKASGLGLTLALLAEAIPVPVRVTGEPVTATFPVIVAVPDAAPVAVGENTTVMVQVAAGVSVALQVPPDCENGAVTTTVIAVRLAPPVLCSVRVCAALVVPLGTLPNASGPPVTLATAVAGPTYSTAPASTWLLAFLALPKKSALGASE